MISTTLWKYELPSLTRLDAPIHSLLLKFPKVKVHYTRNPYFLIGHPTHQWDWIGWAVHPEVDSSCFGCALNFRKHREPPGSRRAYLNASIFRFLTLPTSLPPQIVFVFRFAQLSQPLVLLSFVALSLSFCSLVQTNMTRNRILIPDANRTIPADIDMVGLLEWLSDALKVRRKRFRQGSTVRLYLSISIYQWPMCMELAITTIPLARTRTRMPTLSPPLS